MDVGNLISGSSAFSKSSLNIWKFSFHILLKCDLENFECYSTSVWDECNCAVVWTFFGIAFLWDWNENWPFTVLCMNHELPDVQAGFRKGRRTRDKDCQHLVDNQKSKRVPEKHLLLFYWLRQSLWLCGSQQTVEHSLRNGNTRPPDLPPEKSVCRSRSNS